jgi:hypothetical protein
MVGKRESRPNNPREHEEAGYMSEDLIRGVTVADETLRGAGDVPADQEAAREGGEAWGEASAIVVGQAGEAIVVSRPAPGQTVEIQAVPGQTYVLNFAPGDAQVQVQGDNFVLAFDDNGDGTVDSQIVFLDLVDLVEAGDAPTFQVAGVDIGSDVLLGQALALAGEGEAPLDEVAAGPGATGGGATAYSDNLGDVLDLLSAQGVIPPTELQFGLIDPVDEITLLEEDDLPPEAENTPPEADPVLTPASQGELPEALQDAIEQVGLGGSGAIPAGWTTLGAVGTTDSSFGIAPQQGSAQLTLVAGDADDSAIEAFFGLPAGTFDNLPGVGDAEDGSAIKTTLTVLAGDQVTFHFNFLDLEQYDGESGFEDFAYVVFGGEVIKLADVISTDSGPVVTDIGTVAQTGYNEFTVTFTAAGDFVFGFGVMNEDDTDVDSALLIDNVVHKSGDSETFLTGFEGGDTSDVVFFKQLDVDGEISDDDLGEVADFGGADAETALEDLVFTLQSNPTYGQLILVTSGGTSFLNVGDSFSSADTVWWIATEDQVSAFLEENELQFLPNVEFDYSVTDESGAVATAPVVITIPREVTPPEVALDLYGGADCIEEDSSLGDSNNEVTVTVTPDGDDLLTEIVLSGFQADWTYDLDGLDTDGLGDGVVVTDNGDGTVTITFASPSNDAYNGSFDVQPPADSDVDHPTITATATVADPADPGLTASGDGTLDIHVDANADGGEGSAGDDGDGVHLSVALAVADNAGDDNVTFQVGETGTVTVSATFDDFQDGSETHTVTITAPDGFTIGEVVGDLPAGVSILSNDGSTLVLSVDSQDGDGQDGVGDFSVTFEVTNVDAPDGAAPFTAEARAEETSTPEPDVECDPSDADNVATVTTTETVTVASITPPDVALDLYGGADCIEEDSTLASTNNEVTVTVTPDGDDLLTEIVLSGFQPDWQYDFDGLDTDGPGGTDVVVTENGDGTVTITFANPASGTYNGSFSVQPPENSDLDHPAITATATVIDPVDNTLSASGDTTINIVVDAVVDGSEVEQTAPAVGDEDTEIPLNLVIDLGGDSTTGPGESQGGTDKDGSESVTRLVVMLSVGALMWDLPAAIAAPIEGPAGTWTFDTSGADLADVQDLVASLSVTPPEDFDGDITATVTTTTAESATEAGPNGASGEECADGNNVDVDTYEFTVTVNPTVEPTPVLVVGENVDDIETAQTPHRVDETSDDPVTGEIIGNGGDDVLIGDVGGGALDGKTMNLVLVLDTSDSMEEEITFNGEPMTRIEALDKAVESLLDKLIGTAGLTVRLHMVSFNSDVTGEGTFNIITNGVVDPDALQDAKDFILADSDEASNVAQGNTNYEAGFQAAVDWFGNDANTLDDPDFNKTIFVSDGLPNRSYLGDGTTDVSSQGNFQTSLNHVLGQQPAQGAFPADTVSEYEALLGEFKGVNGTVDAIGINVDGDGLAVLDQVDEGEADSISEGQELADALDGLSEVTQLAEVGDDVIVGNGGADLIFGDAIYTDSLADDESIALALGASWDVIEELRGSGFFDADASRTEVEEIMDFLRDPDNLATYEFGRESVNSIGEGREGGDDTISGGAGADTIFGQEGNDLIDGGTGDDIIIGGTGNDTMTGGDGSDSFVWTDQFIVGESDTITDFDDAPGEDVLDLSALLEGTDPTDGGAELQSYLNITYDGTDTTIAVDVNGDGSGTDVTIVCEGVNLTTGGASQEDIIQSLLDGGQLQAAATV